MIRDIELGIDLGAFGPRTDGLAVGPVAKHEPQRIEQDRLACTGLTGERGHARPELQFELVDDREIADVDVFEHFARSVAVPCYRRGLWVLAEAPSTQRARRSGCRWWSIRRT
jgi:hypothetical protein